MFEEIAAPDSVVAVAFGEKITKEDISRYEDVLRRKLENHQTVTLCVDFADMSDFTADALVEGIKADIELFRHLRQVKRVATVSDKEWPQAVIGLVAPLVPGMEMKHFRKEDRQSALDWAADAA